MSRNRACGKFKAKGYEINIAKNSLGFMWEKSKFHMTEDAIHILGCTLISRPLLKRIGVSILQVGVFVTIFGAIEFYIFYGNIVLQRNVISKILFLD